MFPNRDIYPYTLPDGRTVFGDPVALLRELKLVTRGRLNDLLGAQARLAEIPREETPSEDILAAGLAATGQLVEAALAVFRLPAFDPETGQGTLEDEALTVLANFLNWLHEKKTSGETPSS